MQIHEVKYHGLSTTAICCILKARSTYIPPPSPHLLLKCTTSRNEQWPYLSWSSTFLNWSSVFTF